MYSQEKTVKKKAFQLIRRLQSGFILRNTASDRQENATVKEGTVNQELAADSHENSLAIIENAVNMKTRERCFSEMIDREVSNLVDTVEDRIQNAILTAFDSIVDLISKEQLGQ